MASTYPVYGTVTALTITIASMTNSVTQGNYATYIVTSNTPPGFTGSILAQDYYISGKVTTGTGPTSGKYIYVYVAASDATNYPGGTTSTAGTATFASEDAQLSRLIAIPVDSTSNHTYEIPQLSLCAALGLPIPPKAFSVVIVNDTDVALHATGSNHAINYQAVGLVST